MRRSNRLSTPSSRLMSSASAAALPKVGSDEKGRPFPSRTLRTRRSAGEQQVHLTRGVVERDLGGGLAAQRLADGVAHDRDELVPGFDGRRGIGELGVVFEWFEDRIVGVEGDRLARAELP